MVQNRNRSGLATSKNVDSVLSSRSSTPMLDRKEDARSHSSDFDDVRAGKVGEHELWLVTKIHDDNESVEFHCRFCDVFSIPIQFRVADLICGRNA